MITKLDIHGVCIMVPTPCKEGEETWETVSSVDLEETARMTENVIREQVHRFVASPMYVRRPSELIWTRFRIREARSRMKARPVRRSRFPTA